MSKGRVLVIDDDEWVCRLLSVAMQEAGFEVTISETAAEGFFRAVEEQPDCIVCDVDLPDQKGFWVATKIRAHPSRVSLAPFVFLSGLDDREHRLEGFQVGGDAYITKPFRIDEVVAQVDALIQMAARLRRTRQTLTSIPPGGSAMIGDLAHMSVGTVLTLLDLERRSGTLALSRRSGPPARFSIVSGAIAGAFLAEVPTSPLEIVRSVMGWNEGKFSFSPNNNLAPTDAEPMPINALLMEAARLEDEEAADGDRPSSARLASWREMARNSAAPTAEQLAPLGSLAAAPLPKLDGLGLPPPSRRGPEILHDDAVEAPTFGEPPIPPAPPSSLKPLAPPPIAAARPRQLPIPAPAATRGKWVPPAGRPARLPVPQPKTGFGAMRSLSPMHMKAVVPPPPPSQASPETEPGPESVQRDELLESGWSVPPPPEPAPPGQDKNDKEPPKSENADKKGESS